MSSGRRHTTSVSVRSTLFFLDSNQNLPFVRDRSGAFTNARRPTPKQYLFRHSVVVDSDFPFHRLLEGAALAALLTPLVALDLVPEDVPALIFYSRVIFWSHVPPRVGANEATHSAHATLNINQKVATGNMCSILARSDFPHASRHTKNVAAMNPKQ